MSHSEREERLRQAAEDALEYLTAVSQGAKGYAGSNLIISRMRQLYSALEPYRESEANGKDTARG